MRNGVRQSAFDVITPVEGGEMVEQYLVMPVPEAPNAAEEFIDQSLITRQGRTRSGSEPQAVAAATIASY